MRDGLEVAAQRAVASVLAEFVAWLPVRDDEVCLLRFRERSVLIDIDGSVARTLLCRNGVLQVENGAIDFVVSLPRDEFAVVAQRVEADRIDAGNASFASVQQVHASAVL